MEPFRAAKSIWGFTRHRRQEAIARRESRESFVDVGRSYKRPPHTIRGRSLAGSVNVTNFALCGCLVVVETAIPISGVAGIADIAIRFRDHMALSRDKKKLFPHFGEAGTAVFAVKEVEYGRHDRTPLFDHAHAIISLGVQT